MGEAASNQAKSPNHRAFVLAASVCVVGSELIAAAMIAINRGFGAADMWSFSLWTLPFAAVVGVSSLLLTKLYSRLLFPMRYPVTVLLGAGAGVLWTYVVALFLGPWFGAFSLPVLSCWTGGGVAAMVFSARTLKGINKSKIIVELLLVTTIISIAVVGTKRLFSLFSVDQQLQVVFVQWVPGSERLPVKGIAPIGESAETRLTEEEVAQLEAMGLTGKLAVTASFFHGTGDHSRAVIVMSHQVESVVELAQPDARDVIYLQDGNKWKMYPPDSATLRRTILLEPFKHDPRSTRYMVELADGAAQGGTAFRW